ncbi:unnamed protein product [Pleuronectes platessa]|uniref:Uncharacterized protein n=1 Tax=Pleuronectes platessa TaxID=8262 RepID=A0A9N7U2K2_PLEPL|nr:unnamed protein product [Pleuronectes platessa]
MLVRTVIISRKRCQRPGSLGESGSTPGPGLGPRSFLPPPPSLLSRGASRGPGRDNFQPYPKHSEAQLVTSIQAPAGPHADTPLGVNLSGKERARLQWEHIFMFGSSGQAFVKVRRRPTAGLANLLGQRLVCVSRVTLKGLFIQPSSVTLSELTVLNTKATSLFPPLSVPPTWRIFLDRHDDCWYVLQQSSSPWAPAQCGPFGSIPLAQTLILRHQLFPGSPGSLHASRSEKMCFAL